VRGCGKATDIADGETAATNDPRAFMVRYGILVPPDAAGRRMLFDPFRGNIRGVAAPILPERTQIERQMTENMREISARNRGEMGGMDNEVELSMGSIEDV
jgi:hypothetical protein